MIPLVALFTVPPSEFRPGTNLLLNATIIDASTGNKFTGYDVTVEFFNVTSDNTTSSLGTNSSNTGIILKNNVPYPTDGSACAYMAKILPVIQGGKIVQGIASNPVQLTVSNSTTLLLDVSNYDFSGVRYTLSGCLKHNGLPVVHKLVRIRINDTQWGSPLTNEYGTFVRDYFFWPVNNTLTTYIVTATFEGDTGTNVTAWASTPEGTPYPACTTIQYAYKPSSNATILNVDPRAGRLLRMLKSPDDMRKEAENNGTLRIWNEFTWLPPWWWLHVKVTVNSVTMHVVSSPIFPFWPGKVEFAGLEGLLPSLPSAPQPPSPPPPPQNETSRILEGTITKVLLSLLGMATLAVATASISPLPAAIVATVLYGIGSGYFVYDAAQTYYSSEWGAHTKTHVKLASLLVAFAGAAMAVEMSFSAGTIFKSVVISVLGALLVNLISPSTLETALTSACFSMWTSLFVALAALRIPNPLLSNVYFRPAFLIVNLLLFIITMSLIMVLPL